MAAEEVIIVGEGAQSWAASAADGLKLRLEAAGYNVTITSDPATLTGNLTGVAQVWDVRPNVALTTADSSNYLSYLNDAGGLFLLGENSGFATRNNSLSAFIVEAGGGDVAVGPTTVPSQYVTDIFNGSGLIVQDAATSFYVPASGVFTSPGTGTFITTSEANGGGVGTGVAFGAGSLANAPSRRERSGQSRDRRCLDHRQWRLHQHGGRQRHLRWHDHRYGWPHRFGAGHARADRHQRLSRRHCRHR